MCGGGNDQKGTAMFTENPAPSGGGANEKSIKALSTHRGRGREERGGRY